MVSGEPKRHMNPDHATNNPVSVDDLRNLIGELRLMARGLLSAESRAHSFTPTALAMTALRRAKLKDQEWEDVRWENRAHFFFAIATAMRNALIDHARRRRARGRDSVVYLPPDEGLFVNLASEAEERPERVVHLEEALERLGGADKRLADVVHQFYYAGYTVSEMAAFSGLSEKTVDRDLKRARTLLGKMVGELSLSSRR
jgi:RNA polymerase sigma factor (TIGR02999 family)